MFICIYIMRKPCGKPIVKVGINFDSTKGNIEDWEIKGE